MTALRSGDTLLFIGDSITDCDRRLDAAGLGNGYVRLFSDLMAIREPEKIIRIINRGISGDIVTGLRDRWEQDVLQHRPNWISIKIGINDVHTFLRAEDRAVSAALFAETYEELLTRSRAALPHCQILLIDPFYICRADQASAWESSVLQLLTEYLAVVHQLSARFDTRLVKTHEIFQQLLQHQPAERFCPEPVHPNQAGHLAIAEGVYRNLGSGR